MQLRAKVTTVLRVRCCIAANFVDSRCVSLYSCTEISAIYSVVSLSSVISVQEIIPHRVYICQRCKAALDNKYLNVCYINLRIVNIGNC